MSVISLILLILLFYTDISLMIREDKPFFIKAFSLPRSFYFVYIVLFIAGIVFFHDHSQLFLLMFTFLLPVYLLKRSRFKKMLQGRNPIIQEKGRESLLALEAIGIVLLWILIMVLTTGIVGGLSEESASAEVHMAEVVGMSVWSSLVFLFLIIRLIKKEPQLPFFKALGLIGNKQPMTRLVILPAVGGIVIAAITSALLFFRQFQPVTPMDEMLESVQSYGLLMLFIFSAVLLAPLFEELIFRGFFFYIIKRFKGQGFAIIVIALIFAVLHFDQYWGDAAAILMVTFLGFVLTFFRAWTGTSWSGIVMHYAFNGSMIIFPVLLLLIFNPAFFKYQFNYARLDSKQKEELLYKSINNQPDYAEAYNELAWLFAEEDRNLSEALVLIDEALAHSPDRFAFRDTKAEILYKMKRIKAAVEIARDLVKKYPSNQYALKQLKKFEEAR